MKTDILNNVNRALNKAKSNVQKHSPEILIVTGVIGVVASAVMACKATTKASDIVEETKDQMDKIKTVAETHDAEEYSEEEMNGISKKNSPLPRGKELLII